MTGAFFIKLCQIYNKKLLGGKLFQLAEFQPNWPNFGRHLAETLSKTLATVLGANYCWAGSPTEMVDITFVDDKPNEGFISQFIKVFPESIQIFYSKRRW